MSLDRESGDDVGGPRRRAAIKALLVANFDPAELADAALRVCAAPAMTRRRDECVAWLMVREYW